MSNERDDQAAAPLTLEGVSILHQMFRVRRPAWNAVAAIEQTRVLRDATKLLESLEADETGPSALFSIFGHKGDLMLIHFRRQFDQLNETEIALAGLPLFNYLEPVSSYLSVMELGLYEASVRLYQSLNERGVEPDSAEWKLTITEELEHQRDKMAERLWPKFPDRRYVCFYPMDKRRGETRNWYSLPIAERRRMMYHHGLVGRRFTGQVTQIISGSTGLDDWEWGVDLFADDPIVFKKLVYEMRFDETSAVYAEFGPFYVGIRHRAHDLANLMRSGPN